MLLWKFCWHWLKLLKHVRLVFGLIFLLGFSCRYFWCMSSGSYEYVERCKFKSATRILCFDNFYFRNESSGRIIQLVTAKRLNNGLSNEIVKYSIIDDEFQHRKVDFGGCLMQVKVIIENFEMVRISNRTSVFKTNRRWTWISTYSSENRNFFAHQDRSLSQTPSSPSYPY